VESVRIPVSGGNRELDGALFVPVGAVSRPGLMFVHGLDADQFGYQLRARAVSGPLGIVCLTFDLSGHGASGNGLDDLTPRDHLRDVVAAYDVLAAHPAVDPARIGVCAASYGGYLAVLLAGERPARGLLLRSPGLYEDDQFDQPLRGRRSSHAPAGSTMATRDLARFTGEVLIVASGADEVVPPAVITAYRQANPRSRLVTIAGAPHQLTEPAFRQRFLELVIEFAARL
jgi:pimeloyl-ACP methyl ester carboxylesterase